MSKKKSYVGKYRGTVVNNVDPLQIGRIQALVPDVSKKSAGRWAMPCVPIAGVGTGSYFVPAVGAQVWIEFEKGDPDSPIWVGGFWGSAAEVPGLARNGVPDSADFVLQTTRGHAIVVSDLPGPAGGILLKSASGATISVNEMGITIQNGQGASLVLAGPTVNFNNGALVVV